MQVLGKDQLAFELDLGMQTKPGKCADLRASAIEGCILVHPGLIRRVAGRANAGKWRRAESPFL